MQGLAKTYVLKIQLSVYQHIAVTNIRSATVDLGYVEQVGIRGFDINGADASMENKTALSAIPSEMQLRIGHTQVNQITTLRLDPVKIFPKQAVPVHQAKLRMVGDRVVLAITKVGMVTPSLGAEASTAPNTLRTQDIGSWHT